MPESGLHDSSLARRESPHRSGHRLQPSRSGSKTDAGGRWGPKYGGLVIAAIGFVLTRFVVLTALQYQQSLVQFLLSGGIALVFGLAVIVLGIGLTVGTLSRNAVNTVAKWTSIGVLGMGVITGMGILEAVLYGRVGSALDVLSTSQAINGLIGGAVGGVLVGTYSVRSAENRRELALKVDQATLLNRIIRDKVLNKANVIEATVELLKAEDGTTRQIETIAKSADRLEHAVAEVGFLARAETRAELEPVDLEDVVDRSVRRAREAYTDVTFDVRSNAESPLLVRGNDQLATVFERLFAHLTPHEGVESGLTVSMVSVDRTATVHVSSRGTTLSEAERELLVDGRLPDYDDPSVGFDLPIVSLLVSQYGGGIGLHEDGGSTTIAVTLPRSTGRRGEEISAIDAGIDSRQFVATGVASIVAGIGMGIVLWSLTDVLPAIGGLYGVQSLAIGWVLHLFHSVVFGILFVAFLDGPLFREGRTTGSRVTLGLGYGVLLWLVAAGFVMPLWLNAVGIDATVPRLTVPSFVGHVIWGALLGGLYGMLTNGRPE